MIKKGSAKKSAPRKVAKTVKRVSYSFVMADLLHYGHIKILKTASESADYHVCGLISDEACHLWQGINVCNYDERRAVLDSLDCVDEVLKQDTMDPTANLKLLRKRFPEAEIIVVHGDDWKTLPAREYIESIGGRIIQPEYYAQLSRSTIIEKFKGADEVEHPLGHEFFTEHFRVGNIRQFTTQASSSMVSTKADTLKNFQSILTKSSIEAIYTCTVGDFKNYKKRVLGEVLEQFKGKTIIVRSSSAGEDRYTSSNAGGFLSVADVDASDSRAVREAIEGVIASYKKAGKLSKTDQVLIQNQTTDIKKSGVIFTRNLESNTPYYMINYDDSTGKTDTVTGGEVARATWLLRGLDSCDYPEKWRALIEAVREIEGHLKGMILDIEFAKKIDGSIVIFQIRPLAANVRYSGSHDDEAFAGLVKKYIDSYSRKKPFLSDMAFWNPSEIIGDNPRNLDYALYREIITKRAWNRGLTVLGYSPVRDELMERYGNKPYINLDFTFKSLVPASLPLVLRKKLCAFYEEKLKKDLTAHDKIEFETVVASYDFSTEERLAELLACGFSSKEVEKISSGLQRLTLDIMEAYPALLASLKADLSTLSEIRKDIESARKSYKGSRDFFMAFLKLIAGVEKYSTPQFTTMARMAFISGSLLKSLVASGSFTTEEVGLFMESISTVATAFDADFQRFVNGKLSQKSFLKKYGHLRAGTYDIRAPRYDQMDLRAGNNKSATLKIKSAGRKSLSQARLKRVLEGTPLASFDPASVIRFIKSTTVEREAFKFEFTKSLSLVIELLAEGGELLGLTREDISHLDVVAIRSHSLYGDMDEFAEELRLKAETRRTRFEENSRLVFPPVITEPNDLLFIDSEVQRPNFITQKSVTARLVDLDNADDPDIDGAIVLLKKADPGFDWIFTRKIKGLITRYGGAASHMAIRSAEFNLPAAIGCGELIYDMLSLSGEVVLDCKAKKIRRAEYHG